VVVLGVCWGMNVCLYGVCGPEVPGSEHDVWIGLLFEMCLWVGCVVGC